jgi:hypothetical protein
MHPEKRPNPDRPLEALEAQLRALPQPPIPADLEARLLATIPAELSRPQRRWGVWVGVLGTLAAACVLAVIAWPRPNAEHPIPSSKRIASAPQAIPRPPVDSAGIASLRASRPIVDEAEPPTFTWPLPEPSPLRFSNSIPPDLLD